MAKGLQIITPPLSLAWPNLVEPDRKYGKYGCTLFVEEGHPLLKQIDEFAEEQFTKAQLKSPQFGKGYKKVTNEDGTVAYQIKPSSKDQQLVVDVKGNKVSGVNPWGGTVARVKLWLAVGQGDNPGVAVRYSGAQIIKLVEGGGDRGGFGDYSAEVEDGYVAEEPSIGDNTNSPHPAAPVTTADVSAKF
jgi:hypothetical protein